MKAGEGMAGSAHPQSIASWLLRTGILLHAVALFVIVFTTRQTQFGNLLFLHWLIDSEDPYLAAVFVEKVSVSVYLAAALLAWAKPMWPLLLAIAAYAFLEAYAGYQNGGSRFSDWTIAAQALRFGLPLVMTVWLLLSQVPRLRSWSCPVAASLLRLLVAVVFAAHGYQAWMGDPRFIDLIIGTFGNGLGISVSEATAVMVLKGIGLVDFIVAFAVLIMPLAVYIFHSLFSASANAAAIQNRLMTVLTLWLSLWGLVTALSRMTALGYPSGLYQYPELLIRAPHVLGPLALLFMLRIAKGRVNQPVG